MFDSLTSKLEAIFKKLARHGKLTEADVDEALREVRLALLEADVNFKVVKEFLARSARGLELHLGDAVCARRDSGERRLGNRRRDEQPAV